MGLQSDDVPMVEAPALPEVASRGHGARQSLDVTPVVVHLGGHTSPQTLAGRMHLHLDTILEQ